ncbi:MAG: hypothetical protein QGG74_06390 [Phycisphaerales bacterium]|jgi:hypothetical protein|nr:hypothetical protein [Phycisphaerales bacterium]
MTSSQRAAASRLLPCAWGILAALCIATIGYAIAVSMVGVPKPLRPSFEAAPILFYLHIGCGAVALFVGLLQFNRTLRPLLQGYAT